MDTAHPRGGGYPPNPPPPPLPGSAPGVVVPDNLLIVERPLFQVYMSVVHYISGDEITVGHRTFSEHLWHLSEQKSICSVEVSEQHLVTV